MAARWWVGQWEGRNVEREVGEMKNEKRDVNERNEAFLPFFSLYTSHQNILPLPSVYQYWCFLSPSYTYRHGPPHSLTSHATTQAWLGTILGQKVKVIMNEYFKVYIHISIYGSIYIHVFVRLLISIYTLPS